MRKSLHLEMAFTLSRSSSGATSLKVGQELGQDLGQDLGRIGRLESAFSSEIQVQ